MSIVKDISRDWDDSRLLKRNSCGKVRITWLASATCLLLFAFSPLSAQPAKAKEASTKQPAVAALKSEAPAARSSAEKAPADPALCIKPEASQNAASDEKSSAASATNAPASDSGAAGESASQSSPEFMKDKLKLSLGGKKGSAPDEPLQCGVDEAGSQAKESDSASSK